MSIKSTEGKIVQLLSETNRTGMAELTEALRAGGFFQSPASHKFHGCYRGGLAAHSLRVYELLMFHSSLKLGEITTPGQKPLPLTVENIAVATLLHDTCKIGAYTGEPGNYARNGKHPKGHALLSLTWIHQFLRLDEIEHMMIRYHMGVYGLHEFHKPGSSSGEYLLRGYPAATSDERYGNSLANAWFHNPICKVMYFCDETATMEEKATGKT